MSAKKSRAKRKNQMPHPNLANALKTFDPRKESAENPFGALLTTILGRLDELTHAYVNLGKPGNERFTDIVIARLMTNESFMEKLASYVVQAGIATKQRADALHTALEQRKSAPLVDELPFAKLNYLPPEPGTIVGQDEDGAVVSHVTSEIHSTVGFKPFDTADAAVEVYFKDAVTEEGQEIKEVSRIYFTGSDGKLAELNPESEHGIHLFAALNGNLKTLITTDAQKRENFVSGSLAWVTISKTIFDAMPEPINSEGTDE